jgi:hypothetical protein
MLAFYPFGHGWLDLLVTSSPLGLVWEPQNRRIFEGLQFSFYSNFNKKWILVPPILSGFWRALKLALNVAKLFQWSSGVFFLLSKKKKEVEKLYQMDLVNRASPMVLHS